jgi:hypothetical protein
MLEVTVIRWVEKADRCGNMGGHLLALRPGALAMLCGLEAERFKSGDRCAVRITSIDSQRRKIIVELMP